jgi:hypothetical protein
LASPFWKLAPQRRAALAKDAEDKERIKAERLRAALRANLRRRKASPLNAVLDKAENAAREDAPAIKS